MKHFLNRYLGMWMMSFSLTSFLAFMLRGDEISAPWALATGLCLCVAILLIFKERVIKFQEKFFKDLFPGSSSELNWMVALAMGIGVTMGILYTRFTGIGFSILLGVLSAMAFFLFVMILMYGSRKS
ncbi:MAG: hypothetical protein Q8P27_00865 [Candidatus Peregrinibacteria bacterium]|nr:hypothetical protein [Candidatus Peregrinibacteria bacterium]